MQVERLFENYTDATTNTLQNDVHRKAHAWWHNGHKVDEDITETTKAALLEAINHNTDFDEQILNTNNAVAILLIPKSNWTSYITETVEGECILSYRTSRTNPDSVVSNNKVGVIPLHRIGNIDSWATYHNKNLDKYKIEVYHFNFREDHSPEMMADACRKFFNITALAADAHVKLDEVAKWRNSFPQFIANIKPDLIKKDLLTATNLNFSQAIILLFIGRSWWTRLGATKEHAVMFYRTQVYTATGESEKVVYVSLYPNENNPSALACYPPDFHSFKKDFNTLLQGGANKHHDVEAYRITFGDQNDITNMHTAYKKYLLKDTTQNVQFNRWSTERPSDSSAYIPDAGTAFYLCYWAMGCAWLSCCTTKPSSNCVSLIVSLLGEAKLYTSASASTQLWTGFAHILMILAIGVLFSEWARLIGTEYPVEKADQGVEYCLAAIGVCILASFATYALDRKGTQQFLRGGINFFCCQGSLTKYICFGNDLSKPENVGTLPKTIYLTTAIMSAIVAVVIFIIRGAEHGFSDQFDHQKHTPILWGIFALGAVGSFVAYSLLSCCASETLSCSRPVMLHRDLQRMAVFSSARKTGLTLFGDQPPADLETAQPSNDRQSMGSEISDGGSGSIHLSSVTSSMHSSPRGLSSTDQPPLEGSEGDEFNLKV